MNRPDNIPENAVLASVWYVPGKGPRAQGHDSVYDLRGNLLAEYVSPDEYNATLPEWEPAPDECKNCGRKLRVDSAGQPIRSHADDPYMRGHFFCSADTHGPVAELPEVKQ